MPGRSTLDLVVLVPDKQMEATIRALLVRHQSLSIRPIRFEILVHPRRDPGCRGESTSLLSIYLRTASFSMVLFDREGCGHEHLQREALEENVEAGLATSGWTSRAAVIVIDPELECWIWSDSPIVDQVVGWTGSSPPLRQWLIDNGRLMANQTKPSRPKESLEAALKQKRKRQSASLFADLASRVSLARCSDPAFQKLKATLAAWFPPSETT